jgi:hypothetical protein
MSKSVKADWSGVRPSQPGAGMCLGYQVLRMGWPESRFFRRVDSPGCPGPPLTHLWLIRSYLLFSLRSQIDSDIMNLKARRYLKKASRFRCLQRSGGSCCSPAADTQEPLFAAQDRGDLSRKHTSSQRLTPIDAAVLQLSARTLAAVAEHGLALVC